MNPFETLNRTLFLQINGGDGSPAWLIQVATGIADDLIYLIPLLLLGMWLWGDGTHSNQALRACLVTLLALILAGRWMAGYLMDYCVSIFQRAATLVG